MAVFWGTPTSKLLAFELWKFCNEIGTRKEIVFEPLNVLFSGSVLEWIMPNRVMRDFGIPTPHIHIIFTLHYVYN
jgi:hypothetical protein